MLTNKHGTTTSEQHYDDAGQLMSVTRSSTAYTDIAFATDTRGLVVARTESGPTTAPRSRTYRFGGKEMGTLGNDGTGNVDYATTIERRDDTGTGPFMGGATSGTAFADFDANHRTLAGGAATGSGQALSDRRSPMSLCPPGILLGFATRICFINLHFL